MSKIKTPIFAFKKTIKENNMEDVVKRYKDMVPGTQVYGVDIANLSKEELQALVCWQFDTLRKTLQHRKEKPDIKIVPANVNIKH